MRTIRRGPNRGVAGSSSAPHVRGGTEPLWVVGFTRHEGEVLADAAQRSGFELCCFDDPWQLALRVSPCLGGALVRRPMALLFPEERVSDEDLDWMEDTLSPVVRIAVPRHVLAGPAGRLEEWLGRRLAVPFPMRATWAPSETDGARQRRTSASAGSATAASADP